MSSTNVRDSSDLQPHVFLDLPLTKLKIVAALMQGPVDSARWAEFCSSLGSFKVHIHSLRNLGYQIETTRAHDRTGPGVRGIYVLTSTELSLDGKNQTEDQWARYRAARKEKAKKWREEA